MNGVFCYVPGVTLPFFVANELGCFFCCSFWQDSGSSYLEKTKGFAVKEIFVSSRIRKMGQRIRSEQSLGILLVMWKVSSPNSPWASGFLKSYLRTGPFYSGKWDVLSCTGFMGL